MAAPQFHSNPRFIPKSYCLVSRNLEVLDPIESVIKYYEIVRLNSHFFLCFRDFPFNYIYAQVFNIPIIEALIITRQLPII